MTRPAARSSRPSGTIGFRWGESGKWNLEEKDVRRQARRSSACRWPTSRMSWPRSPSPISATSSTSISPSTDHASVLKRRVPVKKLKLADGETLVASVHDLFLANYGVDRGFGGDNVAKSLDDDTPYTPAWAEKITGVSRDKIIQVAREFATNAEKTNGRSMVIIGAAMNHWYHADMNYRGVINMLVMCGCVGQSGGGWAHYVGQEKLRPQAGWAPLAFALDWGRPPRQQNSTSSFYAHTDQWRYETMKVSDLLSPTAPAGPWDGAIIDYNIRAERMGWLPSAPQLADQPAAGREGRRGRRHGGEGLRRQVAEGRLAEALLRGSGQSEELAAQPVRLALEPARLIGQGPRVFPQAPARHDAWRARQGSGRGRPGASRRKRSGTTQAPEGKLDLLVTLDFRMSTTCVYSDIVLPTATWYEKNDLNTSDMHPFIHPLTGAVDPAWEARSDWEIYKGIAKAFSKVAPEVLGVEKDVVLNPIKHDTANEIAQAFEPKDWKKGECEPIPGKTMPVVIGGRARLSAHLRALHGARAADGDDRQRHQGHGLENRA